MNAVAAALLALLIAAGGACGSEGGRPHGAPVEGDCSLFIDSVDPPAFYAEVVGAVALPTTSVEARQTAGPEGTAQDGLHFAKFGLFVRGAATVEIEIAETSSGRTLVDWALPAERQDAAPAVRFSSCSDQRWLVFAGGVWVESPGSVTLRVSSRNQTADHVLRVERGW